MGRSEFFIVAVKVFISIGFAVIGLFFVKPSYLSISSRPSFSSIFYAVVVLFLAYEGLWINN